MVAAVAVSLFLIKGIVGKSGYYFIQQQMSLGDLNGYIEEMVHGQKVVKVFCHERQAKEIFREKNTAWEHSSASANGYANTMMPMMNALGYLQYVIVAVVGALILKSWRETAPGSRVSVTLGEGGFTAVVDKPYTKEEQP